MSYPKTAPLARCLDLLSDLFNQSGIDLNKTAEKQAVIFNFYGKLADELKDNKAELAVEMTDDIEFLLEITISLVSTYLYLHKKRLKFEDNLMLQE